MEETLANARLIDESQLDTSKVLVLSTVKLKNQNNGMEMKYTLVAESEADLKAGKISVTSPIGKGLLGKSVFPDQAGQACWRPSILSPFGHAPDRGSEDTPPRPRHDYSRSTKTPARTRH